MDRKSNSRLDKLRMQEEQYEANGNWIKSLKSNFALHKKLWSIVGILVILIVTLGIYDVHNSDSVNSVKNGQAMVKKNRKKSEQKEALRQQKELEKQEKEQRKEEAKQKKLNEKRKAKAKAAKKKADEAKKAKQQAADLAKQQMDNQPASQRVVSDSNPTNGNQGSVAQPATQVPKKVVRIGYVRVPQTNDNDNNNDSGNANDNSDVQETTPTTDNGNTSDYSHGTDHTF